MDLKNIQLILNDILCVLVIYNINLKDSETFISLSQNLKQIGIKMDLVIYDNSPTPIFNENVTKKIIEADQLWNIYYTHDQTNPGVSKAYNYGCQMGRSLEKKWLLLLDQDTRFSENSLMMYCESIINNINNSLFAPVLVTQNGSIWSPSFYFFKRGFPRKEVKTFGLQSIKHQALLNSGILIKIQTYEQLGGYNEKIPLYFSDFDFIDRYKVLYKTFVVVQTQCFHRASELEDTIDSALTRFSYYCRGAKTSSKKLSDTLLLCLTTFSRACKLSVRFKSINFVYIFFNEFLKFESHNL